MTIIEMLLATTIMLAVIGAIFGVVHPAQSTFHAQPEISDVHQRLRVAIDSLSRDLLLAGSGLSTEDRPAVMPYRAGDAGSDPAAGVFYRTDTITAVYVPWGDVEAASHTYYLRSDPASGTPQLMQYDGKITDAPLVDHVVRLEFDYFDADAVRLDPAVLQDDPRTPGDPDLEPFDADLLRIRRVRVRVRVEAGLDSMRGPAGRLFARAGTSTAVERSVPDRELHFDVAIRNLNRDR